MCYISNLSKMKAFGANLYTLTSSLMVDRTCQKSSTNQLNYILTSNN